MRDNVTRVTVFRFINFRSKVANEKSGRVLFENQTSAQSKHNITISKLTAGRGCSSVGRASNRHAAEVGSIPRCGKGFFSQSQLSVQTLLRVSVQPRVQSHALTSVRTLKIP